MEPRLSDIGRADDVASELYLDMNLRLTFHYLEEHFSHYKRPNTGE